MIDKKDIRPPNTKIQMLCGFGPEEDYLRIGAMPGETEVKIVLQAGDLERPCASDRPSTWGTHRSAGLNQPDDTETTMGERSLNNSGDHSDQPRPRRRSIIEDC